MRPHLDNMQSMLRMIILLDSTFSTFVEEASTTLGGNISTYLIDASRVRYHLIKPCISKVFCKSSHNV